MKPPVRTHVVCSMLLAAFMGCSREAPAPTHEPITPALPSQENPRFADTAQKLSGKLNAGGVATSYDAHFTEGQLTRITEERAATAGLAVRGEYEFYGARLVKYAGATLQGAGAFTLELDLQGRITQALVGDRAAQPEEIQAIRSRAQLLRSHALAQRATRAHEAAELK